jgi:hypothetical protein
MCAQSRDKKINISYYYSGNGIEKLKTLGASGNGNDDVIFMLIEFWEKHHRQHDEGSSS